MILCLLIFSRPESCIYALNDDSFVHAFFLFFLFPFLHVFLFSFLHIDIFFSTFFLAFISPFSISFLLSVSSSPSLKSHPFFFLAHSYSFLFFILFTLQFFSFYSLLFPLLKFPSPFHSFFISLPHSFSISLPLPFLLPPFMPSSFLMCTYQSFIPIPLFFSIPLTCSHFSFHLSFLAYSPLIFNLLQGIKEVIFLV